MRTFMFYEIYSHKFPISISVFDLGKVITFLFTFFIIANFHGPNVRIEPDQLARPFDFCETHTGLHIFLLADVPHIVCRLARTVLCQLLIRGDHLCREADALLHQEILLIEFNQIEFGFAFHRYGRRVHALPICSFRANCLKPFQQK